MPDMDDTIVFRETDEAMVQNLKTLFQWFEVASGLQVYVAKTKVYRHNEMSD